MPRSLLLSPQGHCSSNSPRLSRVITFSQQSCCHFSQLKEYPLLTSHPLSSYCSISLLPFLAKSFVEFAVLSLSRKPLSSCSLWNSLLSDRPLPSTPNAPCSKQDCQCPPSPDQMFLVLRDMADHSLLRLPSLNTTLSS